MRLTALRFYSANKSIPIVNTMPPQERQERDPDESPSNSNSNSGSDDPSDSPQNGTGNEEQPHSPVTDDMDHDAADQSGEPTWDGYDSSIASSMRKQLVKLSDRYGSEDGSMYAADFAALSNLVEQYMNGEGKNPTGIPHTFECVINLLQDRIAADYNELRNKRHARSSNEQKLSLSDRFKLVNSSHNIPEFNGEPKDGKDDDASGHFPSWEAMFAARMKYCGVPMDEWHQLAAFALKGKAAAAYLAHKHEIDSWNAFCALFNSPMFRHSHTDFSVRALCLTGAMRAKNPQGVLKMISKLESLAAKAPTKFAEIEMLFMLWWCLPDELRELAVLNGDSQPWQMYADLKEFVVNRVNAMRHNKRTGSDEQQLGNGDYAKKQRQGWPKQRNGSSSSNPKADGPPGPRKQSDEPKGKHPCRACGSIEHSSVLSKQGDRFVCPKYDPNFKKGTGFKRK